MCIPNNREPLDCHNLESNSHSFDGVGGLPTTTALVDPATQAVIRHGNRNVLSVDTVIVMTEETLDPSFIPPSYLVAEIDDGLPEAKMSCEDIPQRRRSTFVLRMGMSLLGEKSLLVYSTVTCILLCGMWNIVQVKY